MCLIYVLFFKSQYFCSSFGRVSVIYRIWFSYLFFVIYSFKNLSILVVSDMYILENWLIAYFELSSVYLRDLQFLALFSFSSLTYSIVSQSSLDSTSFWFQSLLASAPLFAYFLKQSRHSHKSRFHYYH